MSSRHDKTVNQIFTVPTPSGIQWKDIESALVNLGAEKSEGRGSRVRFKLNGVKAVFHRPHPKKETDKGAVNSVKRFLIEAGIQNDEI